MSTEHNKNSLYVGLALAAIVIGVLTVRYIQAPSHTGAAVSPVQGGDSSSAAVEVEKGLTFEEVFADKRLRPRMVGMTETVTIPVLKDARVIGERKVTKGVRVAVVKVSKEGVLSLNHIGSVYSVKYTKTNFLEEAEAILDSLNKAGESSE